MKAHIHQARISDQLLGPSSEGILEQFRYNIITSQLLNSRPTSHGYRPRNQAALARQPVFSADGASHTVAGLAGTAAIAYLVAWLAHQMRSFAFRQTKPWQALLISCIVLSAGIAAFFLIKRHWLAYARKRLIAQTSEFATHAQAFDAASGAAMQLVQEVELVSRGYRISSPMPPASRLEDYNQIKRCVRLRRALKRTGMTLLKAYSDCYNEVKQFAVQVDFERYCDIYEITRSDLEDAATFKDSQDDEDEESLKSMQLTLQRVYLVRKIFLCALLAVSPGNAFEVAQWNTIADGLCQLSSKSFNSASTVDSILSEDSNSINPETPREASSPTRERVRTQLRKFTTLSQGIRELQAKIYLLREESDAALTSTDDIIGLGPRLLEQYDSFGADLRNLVQEWEEGRRSLASSITKHEHRASLSPQGLSFSRSTTPSSPGARTATGGSPAEALKILNGEMTPSMIADSSDEELFEAIALPRARVMLTREERIARMREDREQQAMIRQSTDASRHMVKELETVIKLRNRPSGLRTSL